MSVKLGLRGEQRPLQNNSNSSHPMISSSQFCSSNRLRVVLPLCAAALWCGGVLVTPVARAQAVPSLGADYRLGVGDSLQITVSNHPDVNSDVVVRPDGKITLPRAGDVLAAGKRRRIYPKRSSGFWRARLITRACRSSCARRPCVRRALWARSSRPTPTTSSVTSK